MQCAVANTRLTDRLPVVVVLLLLIPLGAWLVNPDQAFCPLIHDSWLYRGYFLDLPGHLRAFKDYYYSTRLSMTLPGWLVFRYLPEVAANHVLHLLVFLAGTLGLYATVRQTVGPRAALLAALLLAGQCHFLGAVSSDYCDGYSMAYFLLATAAAARAAWSPRWRWWLLLTGMLIAALLVTNLSYVLLLGPLGLFLLVLNQAGPRHPLDAAGFWLLIGCGALVGILSVVSLRLGGAFWFLAPSLKFVGSSVSTTGQNPYKRDLAEWLPHAGWLILPLAASVGALTALVLTRLRSDTPLPAVARCYQWLLLLTMGGLIALETTARGIMLQAWFYAPALLLPLSALALAGQWGAQLEALEGRRYACVLGCVLGLPILGAWATVPLAWLPPLMVIAAVAILGVVLPLSRPTKWAMAAAFVLLIVSDLGVRASFAAFDPDRYHAKIVAGPGLAMAHERRDLRCEICQTLHAAMRQARTLDPGYQAAYWFDAGEPLGLLFTNAACLNCWTPPNIVNNCFPSVKPMGYSLRPAMRVMVLSSDPEALPAVHRALAIRGLQGRVLAESEQGSGPLRFRIYLLETTAADPQKLG